LCWCFCCIACLQPATAQDHDRSHDWVHLKDKLTAMAPRWASIPGGIVTHKFTTGMLLGNGDIGVVAGDTLDRQTFYFGKSDFWGVAVKKPDDPASIWQGSILSAGGLTISSPEKAIDPSRAFHMEQNLTTAEVHTTMQWGDAVVRMSSWMADSADGGKNNFFITKLVSTNDVRLHIILWVPDKYKYGGKWLDCASIYPYASGTMNGALWVTRENYNNAKFNHGGNYTARIALAASLVGAAYTNTAIGGGKATGDFLLKAKAPVYLVVSFASAKGVNKDHCATMSAVKKNAIQQGWNLNASKIDALNNDHEYWWKKYWLKSYIDIHDSTLEKFYYGALYVLGCASRAGNFPPSLFGNWITTDLTSWGARYFLNYNEEAAYYGVCSSNRPELMLPYRHLILHEANWQENKTHAAGYQGICHQRSLTPFHLVATPPEIIPVASGKNYKKLPADQKSNGAFATMPLIWYYEYTGDTTYLREKLYPYLKKLEAFYNDYMDKSSKPYHIRHSSAHEGSDDMDPNLDIGFCRRLCSALISESKVLDTDAGMRPLWQDVLNNLADYPAIIRNGEKVYVEAATKNGSTDPQKLFHPGDQPINLEGAVFPGENIYLGGDSVQLQIARWSLGQVGGWCVNHGGSEHNGFPKVWPIAARIGWPAGDLLYKLEAAVLFHWSASNLTAFQGGGGIETAGAIEGINSMLMQSEGGIIRLFPVWPLDHNASFTRLRAKGAFLITASLKNKKIQPVKIRSLRGGSIVVKAPWKHQEARVFKINGHSRLPVPYKWINGNIRFSTQTGGSYVIAKH
ncbi:MAG TPA: hypothetical protein VFX43_05720, partial [Chitinophagaceae bacterium]|nr:hypothetical protein [Chitinophagaceae bacterium]